MFNLGFCIGVVLFVSIVVISIEVRENVIDRITNL